MDVTICGGTLGIFVATSLAVRGLKVAVVERGVVAGRAQEWNISRKELAEMIAIGVLTAAEVEEAISIEFNPNRCGFNGGQDVWVENVLNLGVSPDVLIRHAKTRFLAHGGMLLEKTGLTEVTVHPDGAEVRLEIMLI
jgi:flavin-dependent dehydrogenase